MLTSGANFTIERMVRSGQCGEPTNATPKAHPDGDSELDSQQVLLPVSEEYSLVLRCKPASSNPPGKHAYSPSKVGRKGSGKNDSNIADSNRDLCGKTGSCVVAPSAIKQSQLTKQEVEDRVKFSILSADQVQKCLFLNTKDVINVGASDVTCIGCRKGIENLLDKLKQSSLSCFDKFSEFTVYSSKIKVNRYPSDLKYSDNLYHSLALSKFRVKEIFDSLPKKNKTRCVYHSVNHDVGGSRDLTQLQNWNVLWKNATHDCSRDILKISYDELKNSFEVYVKKHRFCDDCQEHLTRAFRLLFHLESTEGLEDYNSETYQCFSLESCAESGEKYVCVPPDTKTLTEMMDRLTNRLNSTNPNEERHARSLDAAQKEIVLCIAMFLSKRIQAIVMKFSAFVACVELLPHMVWLTFRNSLEEAVEDIEGQIRIEKTLKEIALVDARLEAQKERKREKKRNRKNKLKQSCEVTSELNEATSNATSRASDNHNLESVQKSGPSQHRKRGVSPLGLVCSDGGYSTEESASPRSVKIDVAYNFTKRKSSKSNASSSGMSTGSGGSASSDSSTSPSSSKGHSHSKGQNSEPQSKNSSKISTSLKSSNRESDKTKLQSEMSAGAISKASKDLKCSSSELSKKKSNKPLSLLDYEKNSIIFEHASNELDKKFTSQNHVMSSGERKMVSKLERNGKPSKDFIPQADIDAFKRKHSDFERERERLRQQIRRKFEYKMKVSSGVA